MKLVIRNATIYDPKNGTEGRSGDIFIENGRVTPPFRKADRIIDATGLWALPGGIETGVPLAAHGLAFYGFKKGFPGPEEVSRRYALLGYTHLNESMMFPTTALSIHHYLSSLPYQDTSASLCLSLREFGTLIGSNIPPEWTARFLASCAARFRAINIRLPETSAHFKESALARYNIPAQRVLEYVSQLSPRFPLLIELTSRLLDEELPQHPQLFYSHVGRAIDGEYAYKQVSTLISEKGIMGDIGLAPLSSHGELKIEADIGEGEDVAAFIGMHAPLRYLEVHEKSQSGFVLELATHPDFKRNLAFSSLCVGAEAAGHYPHLFQRLLEADDTYTVSDFVVQTRVLPALLLGLPDKGHLGVGAVGDVALYRPHENRPPSGTLQQCHTLVKNGVPVLENGQFTSPESPTETWTYYRAHTLSERDFAMFAGYFKSYPRLEHLNVPEDLGNWEPIFTSTMGTEE